MSEGIGGKVGEVVQWWHDQTHQQTRGIEAAPGSGVVVWEHQFEGESAPVHRVLQTADIHRPFPFGEWHIDESSIQNVS